MRTLPPLLAFGLFELLCAAAGHRVGIDPWRAVNRSRGDSGHYLSIAATGYALSACPDQPALWCGNAGWMPGYPLLLHALHGLGLNLRRAGLIASLTLGYGVLLWLWTRFLVALPKPRGLVVLSLAGVFPGAIYSHAVFPISAFLVLAIACLDALRCHRPRLAGVAGAAGALTYATGVLMAPVAATFALRDAGIARARRWRNALGVTASIVSGFAAVLLFHAWTLGAWDAFFRVQSSYGHGFHDPLATLAVRLRSLVAGTPGVAQAAFAIWLPAAQSLWILVWVLAIAGVAWAARRTPDAESRLVSLYTLVFWFVPLVVGGGVALHRAEALLLPSVVLGARLPGWLLAVFLATALLLTEPMCELFFRSALL